jgi:hypothetical protein
MSSPSKAQLLAEVETLKTSMSTMSAQRSQEIASAYSTISFKNGEKPLYQQLSTVSAKYNSTLEGLVMDIAKKKFEANKLK